MSERVAEGAVESLYEDYCELQRELQTSPSGLTALNRSYHKHLLLAAASGLESDVKRLVPDIFCRHGVQPLGSFVAKQVMARGYHTLFDWNSGKAQGFFTSFGDACGIGFKEAISRDEALKSQHDAFMLLGQLRNRVVHNNYASATIELTPREIMDNYTLALEFVSRIESLVVGGDTGVAQ